MFVFLALKLLVLPWLMVGLTCAFGMRDARGLALVLLTCSPCAQLSFVLCQQYNAGAELVTGMIVMGVILLLPQSMMVLQIARATGIYEFEVVGPDAAQGALRG